MLQQKGDYLYGPSQEAIGEYLRLNWPYEVADIEPVRVAGEKDLMVWIDTHAGAAAVQRKEDPPQELSFLADSPRRWRGGDAHRMICPCGSDLHEVTVGRQRDEAGRVVWVLIGTRCSECGVLAAPVDWDVISAE